MYRRCFFVLGLSAMALSVLIIQIPTITIDTSTRAMIKQEDPIRVAYDRFKDDFGREDLIFVMVESNDIFDPVFLNRLDAFHHDLKRRLPYIKAVHSLVNARYVYGRNDALVVGRLFDFRPENPGESDAFKKRVMSHPLYTDYLVSRDGHYAALVVERDVYPVEDAGIGEVVDAFNDDAFEMKTNVPNYFSDRQTEALLSALWGVVEDYAGENFRIYVTGSPLLYDALNRAVLRDVMVSAVLGFSVMVFFLYILFRNVSGVLLPAVVVVSALAATVGIMALCGVTMKITTTMLPAFLLAVGVGDSVHILAIFYRRFHETGDKEASIIGALRHSGLAVVMTTLTTAAGLLSFSIADLTAIADIGVFAAIGVFLALASTMLLLPAMIAVFPIRQRRRAAGTADAAGMDGFLLHVAQLSSRHPKKILFFSLSIMAVSVVMLFQIRFSQFMIDWFPDDMQIKQDQLRIDDALRGTVTLEVVVDTRTPGGVYDPPVLDAIASASEDIREIELPGIYVGRVFTINDVIKEAHQALHDNDAAYYTIPRSREIVAQELLLFESSGSEDLKRLADSKFKKTRISVKTPDADAVVFVDFIEKVRACVDRAFHNTADITVTGVMSIAARIITAAITSMTRSYAIAFVVIALMMMLMAGSIKIGCVSMIPNLLPILMVIGIMAGLDIPLDMVSLMIGSIAIGLAVDDTLHFMTNFRKYLDRTGDPDAAVRLTLLTTGRAMLITSMVLSSGFFVVMFSSLNILKGFGFFTGLAVLFALMADFLAAPVLLKMVIKK